ncbi:oxaloacetate decarboxylase subunit gamma [Rodentibacter pneumotropicus]|uniref:Probable oxaloacetate decarboxylase gamma chain n=1 Tax=Rodentibacter pneumotropicus TaxID=758 RepID=A0A1V3K2J9_9PAST|nr:oxaloacetate decarboxylase subunit gamma [Rodentibacter pneumotropicus]MCQ9120171.1 oxaloacetate decarboxylase subunit gamma [Rodentibacter pneumotropicus]NBH76411.1 oxaloacetate decarboxylase subunit gamma [Rodentibacter pneumotropicus]OOF63345.1 oxaloacetate decarboxylase gamma chain [Rodentibacter pneumotropicus]OOF67350.1 oxaloacetate decarboxylase gamma chain [Rodentibacter pneumotropicus]THA01145.1 oxaloacetate decarboxylase subunit gamma [Rodentibacter pneumotropicus]
MTGSELMFEGINLMFAGMGFVIFFLFLLIYAIEFASKIINRLFPEKTPPISSHANQPQSPAVSGADDVVRLHPVIVAAIAHHRRQQGLK